MGDVIHIPGGFYATCFNCGGQEWMLILNGPGDRWDKITGSECSRCGFIVDWMEVNKKYEAESTEKIPGKDEV